MISFKEFAAKWFDGSLMGNVTWRTYDFEKTALTKHLKIALKAMGLTYAGELAVPEFMAKYGLTCSREEAELMAKCWYLFGKVESGRQLHITLRARQQGASDMPRSLAQTQME